VRLVFAEDPSVKISRPTAVVRVRDLDEAVTAEEVVAVVAARRVAKLDEVRASIIRSASGMGVAWVRCPVVAADDLARAGRIRIGWSTARVEVAVARPSYCFKCWREGYVAARCSGKEDRSRTCYRCGVAGHTTSACQAAPCCLLCTEAGRKADHRMGGIGCNLATGRVPPTPIAARRTGTAKPDASREEPIRMEVEVQQQQPQQDPPKEQRPPRERPLRRNTAEEESKQNE